MAKLRSVSTAFWSDPFIEDLTPNQKLLFLYLITNEKTNMLGIYESSIKKISFETGINKPEIEKAFKEFERIGKLKYIDNYVILVNYMKHQNFNTNMKKSAIDTYNGLPKVLKGSKLNISKGNASEGFERLLNHYGMVSKVEVEVKDEIEVEYKEEITNADIDLIYSLYPAKCVVKKSSTGKSKKDKDKIKTMLSSITKDEFIKTINFYIADCKTNNVYMKNFSTFLNNIPDVKEFIKEAEKPRNKYSDCKGAW